MENFRVKAKFRGKMLSDILNKRVAEGETFVPHDFNVNGSC